MSRVFQISKLPNLETRYQISLRINTLNKTDLPEYTPNLKIQPETLISAIINFVSGKIDL